MTATSCWTWGGGGGGRGSRRDRAGDGGPARALVRRPGPRPPACRRAGARCPHWATRARRARDREAREAGTRRAPPAAGARPTPSPHQRRRQPRAVVLVLKLFKLVCAGGGEGGGVGWKARGAPRDEGRPPAPPSRAPATLRCPLTEQVFQVLLLHGVHGERARRGGGGAGGAERRAAGRGRAARGGGRRAPGGRHGAAGAQGRGGGHGRGGGGGRAGRRRCDARPASCFTPVRQPHAHAAAHASSRATLCAVLEEERALPCSRRGKRGGGRGRRGGGSGARQAGT